ncbi:hypothetical protein ONS95_004454 [Cadophora gregata]|uniref:uncharacterized protein n=1 Tax=Cadophora gregata TaxID=51156 RepID=UPI0026DAE539|nr:uncharacterized protein ONS95_004454 [Cadophora gregata]KAK0105942.1 hypothetical protein ONS95_004454 [Cadophora gregata]
MVVVNVLLLIFSTLGALSVATGFGLDAWDVDNLPLALALYFWDEIFYVLILGLCKVSILMFYLRIFPHQEFRTACYVILVWVSLNTIVFSFLTLFQCIPISTNWNGWEKKGGRDVCLNLNAQSFASSGINIAQDVAILLLPIPWLVTLRVTLKKKLHVLFMFSLGIFICICSIVRITKVVKFTDNSSNPTRDFVDVTYWTAIEAYVSIVIPNLPAIRSFLSLKFPRIFGLDSRVGYERSKPAPPTGTGESIELSLTSKTNVNPEPRAIEDQSHFSNTQIGIAL